MVAAVPDGSARVWATRANKRVFGWLSEDDFVHHCAADVDPVRARVMYAVQQALSASAFTDVMGVPAREIPAELVPGG
jgi:hypothetical protein